VGGVSINQHIFKYERLEFEKIWHDKGKLAKLVLGIGV
jgi:hypothetical protein